MKRAFLLLVTVLLAFAGVQAQQKKTTQKKAARIQYGIKAGVNLGNLSGAGINSGLGQGVDVGAFAEYPLSKKWDFVPELYYSLHSLKRTYDFQSKYFESQALSSSDEGIKLHYLSLPLLFRYHYNNIISIDAGPQYNLLFYENDNLLKNGDPAFKKSEIAVNGGITLTLDKFRIYGRYMYGVNNILNIDVSSTKNYKWHSNQVQLGFALLIW